MEAALARVSVLERRRDISYSSAFIVSNGTECIIRGCGSDLSKREHAVRHIKTTSTPEHQVDAIVLQQTECLECGRGWKTPSGLVHHETTLHGEAYTSRMDIFRPLFEQSSCTHFSLMIRKQPATNSRWERKTALQGDSGLLCPPSQIKSSGNKSFCISNNDYRISRMIGLYCQHAAIIAMRLRGIFTAYKEDIAFGRVFQEPSRSQYKERRCASCMTTNTISSQS